MYNSYFHFACSPFENTLDQKFLFIGESHEEVIAALIYFVKERKSFALVCGDVGTGKTMIVHHFLGNMPRSVQTILIPYPDAEYIEIVRYIARVFKLPTEGKGVLELTDDIKKALTRANDEGRQVVLIIDEAHLLPIDSLEHIRLLSNLELTESKLLQILLIGQNELGMTLRRRDMRQLRQRININRVLSPLGPEETVAYMDHRLQIAGSSLDECFDRDCGKAVFELTGGVPRNINRLCDTAFIICMSEKAPKVTRRILKKAHDALNIDVVEAQAQQPAHLKARKAGPRPGRIGAAAAAAVLLLALALGVTGRGGDLLKRFEGWVSGPAAPKQAAAPVDAVPTTQPKEATSPPAGPEEKRASNEEAVPAPAPEVSATEPEAASDVDQSEAAVDSGKTDESVTEAVPEAAPEEAEEQAKEEPAGEAEPADAHVQAEPQPAAEAGPEFMTIKVKKGDTLSRIAAKWFPKDPAGGLKSILAANPGISDENLIISGRKIRVPKRVAED